MHAAPALHGARAIKELAEARTRIVYAREEERKELRRDIHDDVGPTLAGLGLAAAGIAAMSRPKNTDIAEIAEALLTDIRAAIAQTRAISHGLRPPLLDDLGLAAALRHRLAAQRSNDLDLKLLLPEVALELPAAVELAVLRIVQEAVHNVHSHANARTAVVEIFSAEDTLNVRISDDGEGIPTHPGLGVGLPSIRDRAAELGGRAWISAIPAGGTLVRVQLPIGAPRP